MFEPKTPKQASDAEEIRYCAKCGRNDMRCVELPLNARPVSRDAGGTLLPHGEKKDAGVHTKGHRRKTC